MFPQGPRPQPLMNLKGPEVNAKEPRRDVAVRSCTGGDCEAAHPPRTAFDYAGGAAGARQLAASYPARPCTSVEQLDPAPRLTVGGGGQSPKARRVRRELRCRGYLCVPRETCPHAQLSLLGCGLGEAHLSANSSASDTSLFGALQVPWNPAPSHRHEHRFVGTGPRRLVPSHAEQHSRATG